MSKVFEKSKTRHGARLVLLALSDNASDEGVCYPSISTIARKAGLSEQVTREYIHAFEKIKLISIADRQDEDGRQTSNLYQIDSSKIGDDEISAELLKSVRPPSRRHVPSEGVIDTLTPSDPPPSEGVIPSPSEGVRGESSVNHQEEPSIARKPRAQDELFNAIAEVCKVDPATAGSSIGKVKSTLLKSDPPYTPEEVRKFGEWWWGNEWRRKKGEPPSIWTLQEKIGIVRSQTAFSPTSSTNEWPSREQGEYRGPYGA